MQNMLTVNIRAKHFANGYCALRDLSFSARPGEFVAIVGPSGAGKSTLLKIISGLDSAFDGALQLPAQPRIGFLFQEPRLLPWLSVQQNLQLVNRAMTGKPLQQALERVGLKDCAALYPGQLSGGMQRRVALLRAFSVTPGLLLMDEPFQALDAPTAEQLRSHLLQLWQASQTTVLFVTHKLSEALALADRVLFLTPGPSRIALEVAVDLPRPRTQHAPEVQALRHSLLTRYPDLLKGRVEEGGDG
ncbi:MAG: ABC transporter ATP-binding protein [Rhodoferax sp.]|nr:ABC transporter ATP-binding protein [Rhodoferax sp.]